MKIAIITECAMARTHGTGALLLRVFHEAKIPFVHLFLLQGDSGLSECPDSHLLMPLSKWHPSFQRNAHRLLRAIGLSMWRKDELNPRVFERFRRANNISADVAYVVCSRESHAQRYVSILSHLKCPYVVHVMDIYHQDGLDPKTMPGFKSLFAGSSRNIALTDTIREEILKFDDRDIPIIPVGQNLNPHQAVAPVKDQPLKMIMIGRPYPKGTQLLGEAWPRLVRKFPNIEINYLGAHPGLLPDSLKDRTRNLGYVTDQQELWRLVASAHLAYLSGPSELDYFGKFSFPSRCTDYLMAGLPVVASVVAGSATERVLQPLSPRGVRFARNEQEIISGIEAFTGSTESWKIASDKVREFAREHMGIETVRNQLMKEIRDACEASKKPSREVAHA